MALTTTQLGIVTEYEGLYDPIEGTGRTNVRPAAATPELQLHRTFTLKEAYAGLKTDLLEELGQIDSNIVEPATTARDCLAPLKKTIKKREAKRLEYEKTQDKAMKLQRKPGKNSKDEIALVRAQEDVAKATDVRLQMPDTPRSQGQALADTTPGVPSHRQSCPRNIAAHCQCGLQPGSSPGQRHRHGTKSSAWTILHNLAQLLRVSQFPFAAPSHGGRHCDMAGRLRSSQKGG